MTRALADMNSHNLAAARLATIVIGLPILAICGLGVLFNIPADCPPAGCGKGSLAGSGTFAAIFGLGVVSCLLGMAAVMFRRYKTGVALLTVAGAIAFLALL